MDGSSLTPPAGIETSYPAGGKRYEVLRFFSGDSGLVGGVFHFGSVDAATPMTLSEYVAGIELPPQEVRRESYSSPAGVKSTVVAGWGERTAAGSNAGENAPAGPVAEVPGRLATGDDVLFNRYLAGAERYLEVATGRRVPRFHQIPIAVDGDGSDWESIPIMSFDPGTDTQADLQSIRLAADEDTLYGFVQVGVFDDGDGFELSIYPHRDTGVRNGTIANVTAGVQSDETVYHAVFKNPDPDGGGEWSTGYRTTRTAVRGADGIEFSIPISSFRFRGADGTESGIPRQIFIDVEGVTLEPSGEGFDYGGGDKIPGVLLRFL